MELNADFSKRVVVHGANLPWVASPLVGIDRRMLDRVGGEVARATSIVRYAQRSRFSAHTHGGGEEFLVLDGVFQDEHGDFPTGSYVRNPPTSSHTPGSETGCTIFVKLWQFDPADRKHVRVETEARGFVPAAKGRPGVEAMALFADATEDVRLERWAPGAAVALDLPRGGEFLVLDGGFEERGEALVAQSWLRLPAGGRLDAKAGSAGCKVWVKTGHQHHSRYSLPGSKGRVGPPTALG
jgi:anti-sigma factor ChrR (cupin superfamily)